VSPFQKFVSKYARLFESGKKIPPPHFKTFPRNISRDAPHVLIFSPHPDDECIVGGLALRLLREVKWNVANVAVTLGGKKTRRAARLRELTNACDFLGFDLIVAGLENINLETQKKNRARWNAAVKIVAEILVGQKPRVIFLPHENDVHPTHVGTHFLVLDALKTLPKSFNCFVVETEFWGQMENPNLLVEIGVNQLAGLVGALSFHTGEVKRNPYHMRLPAWMMDNVRRGAELVGGPSPRRSGFVRAGGQGGAAPDFVFGTIYRLQKWRGGKLQKIFKRGKFLSAKGNPAGLFNSSAFSVK
jgi:LmbE family N-acetylglucosaminyl deacetylase